MWKRKKPTENLRFLPVDRIYPNPWQARRDFSVEKLSLLAASLARYGMVEPLVVREQKGEYELLAGDRRLRAAKLLGMETVPCRILRAAPRAGAELTLVENQMREPLNPFEEAEALERLLQCFHYSQSELANRLGMSQSTVANKLRLLRLSEEERALICQNDLTPRHARALIRIADGESRLFALRYVIDHGYNVRQTESFVEALISNPREFLLPSPSIPALRPKPLRRPMVKDVRLFCNSVDRAISGIREAGFDLVANKEEEEGCIVYSIRIPKYSKTLA